MGYDDARKSYFEAVIVGEANIMQALPFRCWSYHPRLTWPLPFVAQRVWTDADLLLDHLQGAVGHEVCGGYDLGTLRSLGH
jgi:hypothetical protein